MAVLKPDGALYAAYTKDKRQRYATPINQSISQPSKKPKRVCGLGSGRNDVVRGYAQTQQYIRDLAHRLHGDQKSRLGRALGVLYGEGLVLVYLGRLGAFRGSGSSVYASCLSMNIDVALPMLVYTKS